MSVRNPPIRIGKDSRGHVYSFSLFQDIAELCGGETETEDPVRFLLSTTVFSGQEVGVTQHYG